MTRTSYFGVSAGIALAGAVGAAFADGDVHPQLLAVVNAVRGDVLEPPLAIEMTAKLPSAERLVVFVHGLGETERAWGREPYAPPGWTPAYIRYNTGRPVADNGADLARLLATSDAREIALVGHSMGGLVIHSALRQGAGRVTTTVSLGTPYLGAPLAQAVHAAAAGLDLLPETRPFGNLLQRPQRRHPRPASRHRRRSRARRQALLRRCHRPAFVGRLVGDALVMPASASGRPFHEGLDLGDTHHLALLNHPQVRARLVRWLA